MAVSHGQSNRIGITADLKENASHSCAVAVVISTYNGARFVREQLESLFAQTRLPDEIVICDDCSTDDTALVVSDFIEKHRGTSVEVIFSVNDKNVGWKANFKKLITEASADYIFPCDQDDIWAPAKIERMLEVMGEHSEIDVLACSVEPIYEEGSQKTDVAIVQARVRGAAVEKKALGPDFMYVTRPGCAYCIRKSFVDCIRPYWKESYPHDATLWRFAILKGRLGFLNERLVRFRRHAENASSRMKQGKKDRLTDIRYYLDFLDQADRFVSDISTCASETTALLKECRSWLESRKRLLEKGGVTDVIAVLRLKRFYKTTRSIALDLILAWVKGARI